MLMTIRKQENQEPAEWIGMDCLKNECLGKGKMTDVTLNVIKTIRGIHTVLILDKLGS